MHGDDESCPACLLILICREAPRLSPGRDPSSYNALLSPEPANWGRSSPRNKVSPLGGVTNALLRAAGCHLVYGTWRDIPVPKGETCVWPLLTHHHHRSHPSPLPVPRPHQTSRTSIFGEIEICGVQAAFWSFWMLRLRPLPSNRLGARESETEAVGFAGR